MDGGAWWAAIHGVTRSRTRLSDWLHFIFSLSYIREGNGNPLQCSCLENPRDGGAWWAAIYGVAQSWTRLKWLSSSSSTSVFTARIFSLNLTAARWSRLKIRCFKLGGLLFSDSAVQWAENPDSDLACLFFCGLSPRPAPAVGGTTSAMHRCLPDPSSSYRSHWVCITEGFLPLKCSILKFYEAILNKGLSKEVISSSCTVFYSFPVGWRK